MLDHQPVGGGAGPGGRAASTDSGPGKRTLSEALPGPASPTGSASDAGSSATVATTGGAAPAASLDPAAALALGMRGEERPLPYQAILAATAGIPLDGVRCFFGGPAQLACAQVRAEAFTVGNIIVFGSDAPSLDLVKHELAHVALQGGHSRDGAIGAVPGALAMTAPGDAHEQAAETHAQAAETHAQGAAATAPGSGAPVLARYLATNQQAILYSDRAGQVPLTGLNHGTRVARLHVQDDPGDGWAKVRVTHGGPIETTGFLPEGQLAEHPDEASVDWGKACQLYQELAQGSFDTDDGERMLIPFGYSARSCQARAQAMAQLLSEKGYQCQKVFAVAERDVPPQNNKGALTSKSLLGEQSRWPYHVAPVIRVMLQGGERLMVLDPALKQPGPLSIAAWMSAIGAPRYNIMDLEQVDAEIFVHDERQQHRPPDEKTILPVGGEPTCFVAPSNVYDFMTLQPQQTLEQGESRFIAEGARDLERDHAILEAKHRVIAAIQGQDAPRTIEALGGLSRAERERLSTAEGFSTWLRGQFDQPTHEAIMQAFRAM
jgi:Glutaminase/Domain of unknown function (DUF4157)